MMDEVRSKIKFVVEMTDTGFSAYSPDYPVYTSGINLTELKSNINEAANFYYEDRGIVISPDDVELEMDIQQFFKYYRVINAKFLAKRIGMNETLLSQYIHGKKKPSSRQTKKIFHGIREIGKELSSINLF